MDPVRITQEVPLPRDPGITGLRQLSVAPASLDVILTEPGQSRDLGFAAALIR
jgi:hypothetical protein